MTAVWRVLAGPPPQRTAIGANANVVGAAPCPSTLSRPQGRDERLIADPRPSAWTGLPGAAQGRFQTQEVHRAPVYTHICRRYLSGNPLKASKAP